MLNNILGLFYDKEGNRSSKLTIYMDEKIRTGRVELEFSQKEFAEKIYIRQFILSDIGNGKFEQNASKIGILPVYLKKPLTYFFPQPFMTKQYRKIRMNSALICKCILKKSMGMN
jgi:predicted transcriptional regulator